MGKFLITLFLGWSGIHKFMDKKSEWEFYTYLLSDCLALVG